MLRGCGFVAAVAFACLALTGCAIVDKYSDRAVEYNLQAEKTQQQNLLLNIIRASLRRPMQFTGLQSITGTASASGSVTGGYTNAHQTPYVSLFPLSAGTTPTGSTTTISRVVTGTGSGTASMSGGPTFVVPVLDTQEFYQGILNPVSHQIIDYYVQQGFPPQVLFALFVSSVEIIETEGAGCDRFTFRNDVRNDLRFGQFEALADYLMSSGFTTERVTDTAQYGPTIAAARARNASDTASMLDAYSRASAAGLDIRPETGGGLRLQKRSSHFRFCFALTSAQKPTWLGNLPADAYCGNPQPARQVRAVTPRNRAAQTRSGDNCPRVIGAQGSGDGGSSQFNGVKLSPLFLERIQRMQDASRAAGNNSVEEFFPIERFRRGTVTFKFQTRSVEGILYYLGEITRQHLRPESGAARTTQIKTGLRYGSIPPADCDPARNGGLYETKHDLIRLTGRGHDPRSYNCENLFVLEEGASSEGIFSVSYDGTTYSVPNDPARVGRTLQVLELVKQLLALNTSAKQLPSSGVISIIGGSVQ